MIEAFKRLWDQVSEVLADEEFRQSDQEQAQWTISIGNEIDGYLNDPRRDATHESGGIPPLDGTVAEAWERYANFYEEVSDYVKRRGADNFPRTVTFTTRWSVDHDVSPVDYDLCGPGPMIRRLWQGKTDCTFRKHPVLGSPEITLDRAAMRAAIDAFHRMGNKSNAWSYTYYPHFFGIIPGDPLFGSTGLELVAKLRDESQATFADMAEISSMAEAFGLTRTARPVMIQEIGFRATTDDGANIEAQQAFFVSGAAVGWLDYNGTPFDEAVAAWFQEDQQGRSFWDDFGRHPRIMALSWFLLHDFGDPIFPTWGLHDFSGNARLGWEAYRSAMGAVNPGLGPDR